MAKKGINKVILLGNLGNDPETRYLPAGGAVTSFSLATSESWNNKQTGQKASPAQEKPQVILRDDVPHSPAAREHDYFVVWPETAQPGDEQ